MIDLSPEKNSRLLRVISALTVVVLVAACTEDERACHDRISADLDRSAEFENESGNHQYALIARESSITATVIFLDDDRNICDYVTAGPRLERK